MIKIYLVVSDGIHGRLGIISLAFEDILILLNTVVNIQFSLKFIDGL